MRLQHNVCDKWQGVPLQGVNWKFLLSLNSFLVFFKNSSWSAQGCPLVCSSRCYNSLTNHKTFAHTHTSTRVAVCDYECKLTAFCLKWFQPLLPLVAQHDICTGCNLLSTLLLLCVVRLFVAGRKVCCRQCHHICCQQFHESFIYSLLGTRSLA